MMSAPSELDPTILKALGYFRSNSAESAERLKAMLSEVVESSKRLVYEFLLQQVHLYLSKLITWLLYLRKLVNSCFAVYAFYREINHPNLKLRRMSTA